MNYYNEFDPFAAAWLVELIKDGLIEPGDIDTRSIVDVQPGDLKGYDQCHFFAGIGGWVLALEMARHRKTKGIWTGSPPCQSFSTAGKRKGKEDERHLWPEFYRLIAQCSPTAVFGEQVEAAIAYGWLDDLQDDLEREGYTTGSAVLPVCSIGAPHRRYRLFFGGVSNDHSDRFESGGQATKATRQGYTFDSDYRAISALCNTEHNGLYTASFTGSTFETSNKCTEGKNFSSKFEGTGSSLVSGNLFNVQNTAWAYYEDGKYRPTPIEPSLFPLAHGVQNRVGLLRGAGNAIVPQVAAIFIKSFFEVVNK